MGIYDVLVRRNRARKVDSVGGLVYSTVLLQHHRISHHMRRERSRRTQAPATKVLYSRRKAPSKTLGPSKPHLLQVELRRHKYRYMTRRTLGHCQSGSSWLRVVMKCKCGCKLSGSAIPHRRKKYLSHPALARASRFVSARIA